MNKEKITRLIGLAMRSRNVVFGESNTLTSIKSGKAQIVFIASDISQNTRKRLKDKSDYRQIKTFEIFDRYELGRIIGKEFTGCIAITDKNFVNGILEYIGGESIGKETIGEKESIHNS